MCTKRCVGRCSAFYRVHLRHPKRMGLFYVLCVLVTSLIVLSVMVNGSKHDKRRHILIIIADDLGWNDVSSHGTDQVLTPNIDMLGYAGVTLGRYYSHCVCTPSRSALLTGKYSYTTGMQGYPLTNGEDRGLPMTEKILPQYLKELGYATHLVGKWHVGMSREKYLPTRRGFETHFGHRGGYVDYYEYTYEETWKLGKVSGMDLYRNDTAAWDAEGYITDLYNEEAISIINSHDVSTPLFLMLAHVAPHGGDGGAILQAPPEVVRSMRHVESPDRRKFAAVVKKLDDSVGDVVEALSEKGILNETIILFISDNGGMTSGDSINYGSNYPLRGLKQTPFEGGIRVSGAIWAPEDIKSHLYEGYVHVSDWLPTLLRAIGEEPPNNIDGHDLWNHIIMNQTSSREEIIEIDDMTGFHSIILGDFKLITGNVNKAYSNHEGKDLLGIIGKPPSYRAAIKNSKLYNVFKKIGKTVDVNDMVVRNTFQSICPGHSDVGDTLCHSGIGKVCLFNIKEDPCEWKDISESNPDIVTKMLERLSEEKKRVISRVVPIVRDPSAKPSLFNYTWHPFVDDDA